MVVKLFPIFCRPVDINIYSTDKMNQASYICPKSYLAVWPCDQRVAGSILRSCIPSYMTLNRGPVSMTFLSLKY